MSHRVTNQTEIKDRGFALAAFAKAGIKFEDQGKNRFSISKGRTSATLDLATGEVIGDTDRWSAKDLDGLRQAYAVEAYTAEVLRQGGTIQSQEVDVEGNIVLTYQTTG